MAANEIEDKLAKASIIAALALRACLPRLVEAGLSLDSESSEKLLVAARRSFEELSGGKERVEEFDYLDAVLKSIWNRLSVVLKQQLSSSELESLTTWIEEFRRYLTLDRHNDLAMNMARLRSDPIFMAGQMAPQVRAALIRAADERIIPLMTRKTPKPVDDFDLHVFSFWVDAGDPTLSLEEFVQWKVARAALLNLKAAAGSCELADYARFESTPISSSGLVAW